MSKLRTLYEKRDEQFSKETIKIFKIINTTLGCVTTYLSIADEAVAQGIISWEDSSIIENMVIIVGTIEYELGDVVTLVGVDYTITEDNIDEFQRVVHMAIPFALVEEGSEEKIMEYLQHINDNMVIETPTVIQMDSLADDFDLSELTESQRQALKFSTSNRDS